MGDAELVRILLLIGTIIRVSSSSNPTSAFQRVPRWRRHLLPSFLEHRPHSPGFDHQENHQQQPNRAPDRGQQSHHNDNRNVYPSVTFAHAPPKWGYVQDSQNYDSVTTIKPFETKDYLYEYTRTTTNSVTTIKPFETKDYLYEYTKATSNVFEYRPYTTYYDTDNSIDKSNIFNEISNDNRPYTEYYNTDNSIDKSSIFNEISNNNEIDFSVHLKPIRSTNLLASASAVGNAGAQILTQFIPNQSVKYPAATVPFSQIPHTFSRPFPSNINNNVGRPVQSLCLPSTITDTKIQYITINKRKTITACPVTSVLDDYLQPVTTPPETIKIYSTVTYTLPQNTVTVCPVLPVDEYLPPISAQINEYLPPINSITFTTSLTKYSTIISTLPAKTVINVETATSFKTFTTYLTSTQTETTSKTLTETSTAYVRDIQTVTETQPPQTVEVTITSKEFFISTVFQPVVEYITETHTRYSQYCGGYGYKIPSSAFINS